MKRTGFSYESKMRSYQKMLKKKRSRISKKIPKRKRCKVKEDRGHQDAKKRNKEYKRLRQDFLLENPRCQFVDSEGNQCTNQATDVHHKAGRAKYHNRVDTWMATCRECHMERIHGDPEYAYKMGYLINAQKLARQEELENFEKNGNFLKQ